MVTSPLGSTPVHPSVNVLSRRDIVLSGLIGTVGSLVTDAVAVPKTLDIPTFESGRYQFPIVRPLQELPSIRLLRLEGAPLTSCPAISPNTSGTGSAPGESPRWGIPQLSFSSGTDSTRGIFKPSR